ncbi:MAG: phage portal protein [Pseudomonadota bacterium]
MSGFLTKARAALMSGLGPILDRVTTMRHAAQSLMFNGLLKATRINYRKEVGDGLDSSVVTAPIMFIQRALPEARLSLRLTRRGGEVEELDDHDMLKLIRSPNEAYGDIALWSGTILSLLLDGNAYWIKVRNLADKVVELWWVPHTLIEPKAPIAGEDFISHYEYTPGTGMGRMALDPRDVVHFRHGINPRDIRRGLAPIDGVLREIYTDLESSNFIAALLRNSGVPGVIISPKGGAMPNPDDVKATERWFDQKFTGDGRGQVAVMGSSTEVSAFGFNPEQMNLSHGSDRAEERMCACLGIPAAVVGFGAGLQSTKVGATMEEMRKLAWHNGVLPIGRMLADELQRSLLPDFGPVGPRQRQELYWNTDDVLALQEDENKQIDRKLKELQAGAITLYDYLTETGREADDSHRYYMRSFNVIVEPEGQALRNAAMRTEALRTPDPALALPSPDQPAPDEADPESEDENAEALKAARAAIETKHIDDDYLPADAELAPEAEVEAGGRIIDALAGLEEGLRTAFERALIPLFEGFGAEARAAAQIVLTNRGEKAAKLPFATKASDEELIEAIIRLMVLDDQAAQLSARYRAHYRQVAERTVEVLGESGFGTMLPDPVMQAIIAEGGTRSGLIDLDKQTRDAIFAALAEGGELGEGVDALAARIEGQVGSGRYSKPSIRAKLIARTETKHAQNVATVKAGVANGFTQFLVFDGRLGPGRSEPSHIARNGWIVSPEDAMTMAVNMRPNCTLSFAPRRAR